MLQSTINKYNKLANERNLRVIKLEEGRIHLIDNNNYKYNQLISNFRRNVALNYVSKYNTYTIENINKYISNNHINIELLSTSYVDAIHKLIFKCKCGSIFDVSWDVFSRLNKHVCNKCSFKKTADSQRLTMRFIKQYVKEIANDEIQVLSTSYYKNSKPLLFQHKTCGKTFYKSFTHFKRNPVCKYCAINNRNESYRLGLDAVKKYIKDNNLKCQLISKKYINTKSRLKFKCECGNYFYKSFQTLKRYKIDRCKVCTNTKSTLEVKVEKYLIENKIQFKHQEYVNITNDIHPHSFDFKLIIDKKVIFIECQGIQHYEPIEHWGGEESFKLQKLSDQIKCDYAKKYNIPLLIIPYWEFDEEETYKKRIDDFMNSLE